MPESYFYPGVSKIIANILTTPTTDKTLLSVLQPVGAGYEIEFSSDSIQLPELHKVLCTYPKLVSLLERYTAEKLPLDIFIFTYLHVRLSAAIAECGELDPVLNLLKQDALYIQHRQLRERLRFAIVSYRLAAAPISWKDFTANADTKNREITWLLFSVLPVSRASLTDVVNWIGLTTGHWEQDFTINLLGNYVYCWAMLLQEDEQAIDQSLLSMATHRSANMFFSAFLKGVQDRQQKGLAYYCSLLSSYIEPSNAFYSLYGLGLICQHEVDDKFYFFLFLRAQLDKGHVSTNDFIRLCASLQYYNKEAFDILITAIQSTPTEAGMLLPIFPGVITWLRLAPAGIDKEWEMVPYKWALSQSNPAATPSLNTLLAELAEKDLNLAYNYFIFRIKIMGGTELLEFALITMVSIDTPLFQRQFIGWLVVDDPWIHNAVFFISGLIELNEALTSIPVSLLISYTNRDKLFAAHKAVGYIYKMEVLQSILLGLTKSVEDNPPKLLDSFEFILTEYLVYNYRSTLDLIKNELSKEDLPAFARSVFMRVTDAFAVYFEGLGNITVKKELQPSQEQLLLRRFYQRKISMQLMKGLRDGQERLPGKTTTVNANKWAIKRPGQRKHQPSPLGHFSVSGEFPSGERLNPIYQEYIRHQYKKLKKDEINFD